MPHEQVQWFRKDSVHDSDDIHARQSCTYYSIINVNKANYPFLSSYEQAQTWTLTRTISNNPKRYQSSIENIHLTAPITPLLKSKHVDYENVKIKKNRSNSVLPSSSSIEKYKSTAALQQSSSIDRNNGINIPIKTITTTNSFKQKKDSNLKRARSTIKPMRVIHSNGEFVVRI